MKESSPVQEHITDLADSKSNMGLTFEESESSDFKKIQFDIDIKINEEGEDHTSKMSCELFKTFPFTFLLNDSKIYGDLWIKKSLPDQAGKSFFWLGVTIYNLKSFLVDMNMLLIDANNPNNKIEVKPNMIKSIFRTSKLRSKVNEGKSPICATAEYKFTSSISLASLNGKFILTIETKENNLSKDNKMKNFKSFLCDEAISNLDDDKNFTLICEGEKFHFNKSLLSIISEVFGRMIQASNSKEALTNSVQIDDFSTDTIKAFQRVTFGSDEIKDEDLTPDLLMFAQKYLMKRLVMKIKARLMDSLTIENVFDVIKAAYLIDDQDMFKKASKYLLKNKEQLKGTPEWNAFKKEHSDCMIEALAI